jgi:hypothetical protein
MSLIQRLSARELVKSAGRRDARRDARRQLTEAAAKFDATREYDIFLSHSYHDARLHPEDLLELKGQIEELGLSVYVDWIEDPALDRTEVTKETAERLRQRMRRAKALLFAVSENSSDSRWMPWELGYCDGRGKPVAVAPLVARAGQHFYEGQEYLGLYPYLSEGIDEQDQPRLYVETRPWIYRSLEEWIEKLPLEFNISTFRFFQKKGLAP